MAGTSVTFGSSQAETIIRHGIVFAAETRSVLFHFRGADPSNAMANELDFEGAGEGGSTQRVWFQGYDLNPEAKVRGQPTWGHEGTETRYSDTLDIRYFKPVDGALESVMSDQQHVSFSLEDGMEVRMATSAAAWFERGLMRQLAGDTRYNDTATYADYKYSLGNVVTSPDAFHWFFADGASATHATEAAVAADSTAVLTQRGVSKALMKLRTYNYGCIWPLVPCDTPWGPKYLVVADPEGLLQVRQTGPDDDFRDVTLAEIQAGLPFEQSVLATGEGFLGPDNTLYIESNFAPWGLTGVTAGTTTAGSAIQANCKRALVLGARAAHIGWGRGFTGGLHLRETEVQIHERISRTWHTVCGAKAVIVNSQRWGSAILSHYVEATTEY